VISSGSLPIEPSGNEAGMTSGKPSNVQQFGEHTLEFEPPDVCILRLGQTFTVEDYYAMIEAENRVIEEHGPTFLLSDYSRVLTVGPEVRKLHAEVGLPPELLGVVVFGVSFHVRVLAKLSLSLRALANKPRDMLHRMVGDEAEARAVVAAWRRDLQKPKGG
jgi:hypothetical protein